MLFFVDEKTFEIVGYSDMSVLPPPGMMAVEGEGVGSEIYFDPSEKIIKPVPPQPPIASYWDKTEWVEITAPIVQFVPNWANFLLAIIQTPTYEKIKSFLSTNNPAEYTVLVALLNNSAIPSEPRLKLLQGSLRKVSSAMKDSPTPLSSKDVGTINSLLQSELGVSWDING